MVSVTTFLCALAIEGALFAVFIFWQARQIRDLLNRLMSRDFQEYREAGENRKPPTGRNHILKQKLQEMEGGARE